MWVKLVEEVDSAMTTGNLMEDQGEGNTILLYDIKMSGECSSHCATRAPPLRLPHLRKYIHGLSEKRGARHPDVCLQSCS